MNTPEHAQQPSACDLRYGGYTALLADHTALVGRVGHLQRALRQYRAIIEQLLVVTAEQDARITTLELAWQRQQTLLQETVHEHASQPV